MITRTRRTRLLPVPLSAFALAASGLALGTPPAQGAAELTLVPKAVIGGPGHAGLYGWGAATMCDGSVLVGDYWNMRVRRFAPDGKPLPHFIDNAGFGENQHQAPYGLAVDPDTCEVYLADTDRRQVDVYSAAGDYVRSFGQNGVVGETPTTFRYPSRKKISYCSSPKAIPAEPVPTMTPVRCRSSAPSRSGSKPASRKASAPAASAIATTRIP